MMERDTGPEAGAKGLVEGIKGQIKKVAGSILGNDRVRREGNAQVDKAAAQRDVARKEAGADRSRATAAAREAEQRYHQD